MTGLLVVHDLGGAGGAPWATAFAGWPGPVHAPDLPGHGTAPMPLGGHHEVGDAVFHLVDHLSPAPGAEPVVVGVGTNGHVGRVFALAGRAGALVLVDGLGGPWLDAAGRNAGLRAVRRQILATPAALAPHEPGTGGTDPRASLHLPHADRAYLAKVLAALPVPTLVVETPASPTPDADDLVALIPDGALVRVGSSAPAAVAEVVVDWFTTRSPVRPG